MLGCRIPGTEEALLAASAPRFNWTWALQHAGEGEDWELVLTSPACGTGVANILALT